MSTDRTLDRIDDTLAEWDEWDGHSPDAARWAGEPDESEWPQPRSISFSGERRFWLVEPSDGDAPTLTELGSATEFTPSLAGELGNVLRLERTPDAALQPFLDAMATFVEAVYQLCDDYEDVLLKFVTGKSVAYYVQRAQRPQAAAERTRSPQWRSGTRRTKRHARRRHG